MIVLEAGPDLREKFAYLGKRADVLKCCGIVDNLRITEYDNRNIRAVCIKCYRKHRLLLCEPQAIEIRSGKEWGRETLLKRSYRLKAETGNLAVKKGQPK